MDKTQLLVKNIPKITEDIENLLRNQFRTLSVKSYGRCRAILRFADEATATIALHNLHQKEFYGRVLSVEYLGVQKLPTEPTEASPKIPQVSDFVKNLYATSSFHGFEQPPPPSLKYNYPPINRTILDSISIALLTNSKFYVQVLHLMNRMNMEPPFVPLRRPFVPPGEPCNAQTQTDVEMSVSRKLLASDESELESDEENTNRQPAKKRKPSTNEFVIKTKMRKIISSQLHEKQLSTGGDRRTENLQEIFEGDARNLSRKISLNVSTVTLPEKNDSLHPISTTEVRVAQTAPTPLVGRDELAMNRIPESQWKDLAVYKNYQRGEKSNKLYVKNLSKEVSEDDLRQLYSRFARAPSDISVKLMLFGKMKGQAFVTFDKVGNDYGIVEKALDETNGYIFKNKPMVVCFGKKS